MTAPRFCDQCGAALPEAVLVCPACQQLVHSARLRELAAAATASTSQGDTAAARAAWQEALTLLPPETVQAETIRTTLANLDRAAPAAKPAGLDWKKVAAAGGPVAFALWKFKWVAVALLTKAKFLVFGLKNIGTVLSMLASLGLYWAQYGWKFGLGLLVSIYIHEMGHLAALKRFGIPASAPMFIPGFGAFVRMQATANPLQDSRVGLAGPIWGLGAAAIAAGAGVFTGSQVFFAIAAFGAWVNLFNLLPVWQLDGGRGFRSLTRKQRALALGAILATWIYTGEGLLFVLLAFGVYRLFSKDYAAEPDNVGLMQYAALVLLLALLTMLRPVAKALL